MKKYVVIARFDDDTNQKMLSLRDKLMSKGYSVQEWPPHITLAAYENCDEESIKDWIRAFVKSHHEIEVGMNSITILPPSDEHTETAVLCFAPTHKKDFVDFYYQFHDRLDEYCTGIGCYYSKAFNNPIFHSSIGVFNVNCLQDVMNIIFSSDAFGSAKINALELYTYPMQLIERYELTNEHQIFLNQQSRQLLQIVNKTAVLPSMSGVLVRAKIINVGAKAISAFAPTFIMKKIVQQNIIP